jgi:hypothetical protein
MPFTDIDTKKKDKMLNIAFSMIKGLINWREIQRYVPNPLFMYSDKKKCQILLAFADATSMMGRKFNTSDDEQYEISEKYLDNFRMTRSLKYMKSYRKHFLLDPFNISPNYDKLLAASKYSFTEAQMNINIASMNMIAQLATDISNQTGNIEISDDDEDADDKLMKLYTSSIVCYNLAELSEKQQCNFMRCALNVVDLLFELQSLEMLAFEDDYLKIQKRMDEFYKKKLLKRFGDLISAIVEHVVGICKLKCNTKVELNKDVMKTIKSHEINIVNTDYDFELDFTLAYESPCIIENTSGK